MKQHRGKFVAGLAFVACFGVAASAIAQAPADTTTPSTLLPAPTPMSSDDMSGQVGFGAGVSAGTSLIVPGAVINIKYWLSDKLAVMPQLQLQIVKAKGYDTSWRFNPSALVLYCPWKTTSTRLTLGGGLGLTLQKWGVNPTTGAVVNPPSDTTIGIRLPVYAGVEHFFTKWFSMGIAVQNDLLSYTKVGSGYLMTFGLDTLNSTQVLGSLFFYTD